MDNCLFCEHFYFYPGSPHYSELTPGESGEIGCGLDYWDWHGFTDEQFRYAMLSADSCEDYNPVHLRK